jgi:hypothetical protein
MKAKTLAIVLSVLTLAISLFAQQSQTYTVLPAAPVPQVTNVSVQQSQPGTTTYFYWIVSNNGTTFSPPAGPFEITGAPNTLSAAANDKIVFAPVAGVSGYDVLRTATSAVPSGACNCAVVINTASGIVTDTSNTLLSYTVNAMGSPYVVNNTVVGGVQTLQSCYAGNCTPLGGLAVGSNISVNGQFNVKSAPFNAIGDVHSSRNISVTVSSAVITDTDNPWVAGDVGKFFFSIFTSTASSEFPNGTKIIAFTNSGQVTLNNTAGGTASGGVGGWYTQDETAPFLAAQAAAAAATAHFYAGYASPNLSYPATVFIPPGGYAVSGRFFNDTNASNNTTPINLIGSGNTQSVIYVTPAFVAPGSGGALIQSSGTTGFRMSDFAIEGSLFNVPVASNQNMVNIQTDSNCDIHNLMLNDLGSTTQGADLAFSAVTFCHIFQNQVQNSPSGTGTTGILVNGFTGLMERNFSSNMLINWVVSAGSRSPSGVEATFLDDSSDECAIGAGNACAQFTGSVLNLIGGTYFSTGGNSPISLDGTTTLYASDIFAGPFNSGSGTGCGVIMVAGSKLYATGSTFAGESTGSAICGPSTAFYKDDGLNTLANEASGVLTNCTPATQASAACGWSGGIQPVSSLTHTPNSYTFVATFAQNVPFGNMKADQNYQIVNIKAIEQSTTVTACTTAPILTITDGSQSATLTLTSGKTSWDSSVDTSTGINNIFTSGNTITMSITNAFTCATPPVDLTVTPVLQSVLNQ